MDARRKRPAPDLIHGRKAMCTEQVAAWNAFLDNHH
jgi:hypothetical protein